ncbi:MAG: hypothetical protein PHN31_01670 [Candidatus Gracilibacteria bacterium]|nr:hypothetical protein [Candidatus Gracilibacteria bacterium]
MRKLNKEFFKKHPDLKNYFIPKFKNKTGYFIYKYLDDLALLYWSVLIIIFIVFSMFISINFAMVFVPIRNIIFL